MRSPTCTAQHVHGLAQHADKQGSKQQLRPAHLALAAVGPAGALGPVVLAACAARRQAWVCGNPAGSRMSHEGLRLHPRAMQAAGRRMPGQAHLAARAAAAG